MFSEIFESSIGGSSTSSLQLRSKFIKKVQNPKVRYSVLAQCEEFIKLSVHDAFLVLMQTASSSSELIAFTELEWAELTEAQLKIIWSEFRSQYNTVHHILPEAELFFNCSKPYMEISDCISSEHAMSAFKYIITYLRLHSQSECNRLIYLLTTDKQQNQLGGLHELGFSYDQAEKFIPAIRAVATLATELLVNDCYTSTVDLLQNLSAEANQPDDDAMDENFKNVGGNEMNTNAMTVTSAPNHSFGENTPVFSFKTIRDLVDNYYLLTDTFDCFAELRELGIDPIFLLEHENEFKEFINSMNNFYKGDRSD